MQIGVGQEAEIGFRLIVQKTGETFSASVVWREPQQVGVAFEAPGAAHAPIEITLDRCSPDHQADGPYSVAHWEI